MNLTRRLTDGVGAWLHFEFCCQRSGLFSERYLSAAVGQLLNATYGGGVHAEFLHPVLAPLMTGSGKRPTLDFVYCATYPTITVAVETKWAGSSHTTAETIIWDLIRLELVAHHYGAQCVFVLAGQRRKLDSLFDTIAFSGPKHTGGVTPILRTTNNGRTTLSLLPNHHYRIPLLRRIFSSAQQTSIPHRIVTRRARPFPAECTNNEYQVYAWEICSEAIRQQFLPADIDHYRIPQIDDH